MDPSFFDLIPDFSPDIVPSAPLPEGDTSPADVNGRADPPHKASAAPPSDPTISRASGGPALPELPLPPDVDPEDNDLPFVYRHFRPQPVLAAHPQTDSASTARPRQTRTILSWLNDFYHDSFVTNSSLLCAMQAENDLDENILVEEALAHPGWRVAMLDEINSHAVNGTSELTSLPPGHKALHA
jgi:hypothetical protein